MEKQLYYDDITEGMEMPDLVKHPTTRQLVKWAGASGDFYEIHYDKEFALSQGQPNIIVPGDLTGAFLVQLLTNWMGEWDTFKKLKTINLMPIFPKEDPVVKGR